MTQSAQEGCEEGWRLRGTGIDGDDGDQRVGKCLTIQSDAGLIAELTPKQQCETPMNSEMFQRLKKVPTIVSIVLAQLTKLRALGKLTETVFQSQIQRLAEEELEPRALTLLVRDLPNGCTRFLVKETATGVVCDMIEFERDGAPVTEECSDHAMAR